MQCKKCKGEFYPPENIVITNCPFCQAPLKDKPNVSPDSNEGKILKIIEDRGEEIYTKKEFIGLILDYFPNDKFGNLLKMVITNKGALYVSKLKQYSGNELQIKYAQLLDKLSDETFIAKDILTPAIDLLCFGLGLEVQSLPVPVQQPVQPESPLNDFEIENGELKSYIGKDSNIVIPNSVTEIGHSAFKSNTNLNQVIIPNSVTSIGVDAFLNCTNLCQITIPNSVTIIGGGAFLNCTNLSQITIPNSVTTIGGSAFKQTPWYNNLNEKFNIVGNSILIKYIGNDSQITIPNSVTVIGGTAFRDCTNLNQINIPNSVTTIGDLAFNDCTNLKEVSIPNSMTEIGVVAFMSCSSLNQINIPDSVTTIGFGAFMGCKNLPENVLNQIKAINPKSI